MENLIKNGMLSKIAVKLIDNDGSYYDNTIEGQDKEKPNFFLFE